MWQRIANSARSWKRLSSSRGAACCAPTVSSHRLIRIDHNPTGIRRRTGRAQHLPILENPQAAADRHRVHEDVELVDEIVLDQCAHKRRSTIDDDVLAALTLQLVDRLH